MNVAIMEPTLHKPIPLGSRVMVPAELMGYESRGTVVGISSMHVVFVYIVLLDIPHKNEYGEHRAIAVGGPQLESEDRKSNWRLVA